jgi:hypothetical protein
MIDLCLEGYNGWLERIVGGKMNGKFKQTTLERRVSGTEDHSLPLEEVLVTHGTRCAVSRRITENISILAF